MIRRTILIGLALAALGACGSGEGDLTGEIQAATTPEIAVRNLALSVRDGDREAFLGGFQATALQKDLLEGAFEFMDETRRLRDAVIREWGESGWDVFTTEPGAELSFEYLDDEQLDRMKLDVRGDLATATLEGEDPLELVKVGSEWKIDAAVVAPTGSFRGSANPGARMRELARIVRECRARVGESGLTAEQLDEALGNSLLASIMDLSGPPGISEEDLLRAIREAEGR